MRSLLLNLGDDGCSWFAAVVERSNKGVDCGILKWSLIVAELVLELSVELSLIINVLLSSRLPRCEIMGRSHVLLAT